MRWLHAVVTCGASMGCRQGRQDDGECATRRSCKANNVEMLVCPAVQDTVDMRLTSLVTVTTVRALLYLSDGTTSEKDKKRKTTNKVKLQKQAIYLVAKPMTSSMMHNPTMNKFAILKN